MDKKGRTGIKQTMQHGEVPTEVRQFQGLWLPVEILKMSLSPTAKLLWADIHSFTGRSAAFFKSNQRISEDYGISQRTASRALKELELANLIDTETDGRKRWCRSRVDKLSIQPRQNVDAAKTNSLHSKQESKQTRKHTSRTDKPNNRNDVHIYFNEVGSTMAEADKFVDYYEANGWSQGRGKQIKDWKAAARNWTRNANKWKSKSRGFDSGNFSNNGAIDFVNHG